MNHELIDEYLFFIYDKEVSKNIYYIERRNSMKKGKRILAMAGVIILIGLYVSTLVCAIMGSENTMNLLMSSVYATVVLPVLIWAYQFIYKLIKKSVSDSLDVIPDEDASDAEKVPEEDSSSDSSDSQSV